MNIKVADYLDKDIKECSDLELYNAVLKMTQKAAEEKGYNTGKKKLYYISAEFLIGKLLSNNLINLGLYDAVKEELESAGKSLARLEELEMEPSLGNGGLGRLAACFIDSCATLSLPADGVGLAYHCGLFRQVFSENKQSEIPDQWLKWGQESWLRRTDKRYTVSLGDFEVQSVMYEIAVTGYDGGCTRLRLFDTDSVDERVIGSGISFDKKKYAENLTLFLYPDDSDEEGRLLRVYQEYFMVANAARLLIDESIERGSVLTDLADYAAVQINDTHPSMVIPELIRLLCERGIGEDEAIDIVTKVCGYTNHTILAEALETWPRHYLEQAVPQLLPIIDRLDERIRAKYDEPFVQIIDEQGNIHMANMDIHFSHSTNGVAALHTEILKNSELAPFYKIYPERFNNKTNGITYRRWLLSCNKGLSDAITEKIGDGWIKDAAQLEKLMDYEGDKAFLEKLSAVKKENKKKFAAWINEHQGSVLNPEFVFDVQSKRLHEYKRQQLNLLWIIRTYLDIREGKLPVCPVAVIFGAKAAPAYTIAKDIIHAILSLSALIEKDPAVKDYLKIVMIENYNVTAAEKLIPACDISEQISLASKEASGTGNMKFMANGAVTLGTMDGANVEIADLVGKDCIFTFGQSSDKVIEHYAKADYVARDYYEKDKRLKETVDFLIGDEMYSVGNEENLFRLHNELVGKDWFMTFPDFADYCRVKAQILEAYKDTDRWEKMALTNIARSGFFSSDRTIRQYNEEIWHL
jgi:starch phosphorylase